MCCIIFFFNDTATTEIYTLSLHDALPIFPNGYHINSNRPTNKFMIPTAVRVTAPRGVRVGPVRYPRANVRSFSFAPGERIPVFEGNPAVRFDVTVPATYAQDKIRLRVVVSYQACSDEACFRPAERDMSFSINVAD